MGDTTSCGRLYSWLWLALATAFQLFAPLAVAEPGLTVRVESSKGAPRWIVNGEPKRARVFWGAPGPSLIPVSSTVDTFRFEFVALETATNGTMHFRFGQSPGEVSLDDIQVTDVTESHETLPRCDFEAGRESFDQGWMTWPQGTANTVADLAVTRGGEPGSGHLHILLRDPAEGTWPDFHIYHRPTLLLKEGHRYAVSFRAQAHPARSLTVAFYQPGDPFVFLGGPSDCFAEQIRLAAGAGVDFISFPVGLPWPKPGYPMDFRSVDSACKGVLNANPRALLIPRIPIDPPVWWREAHPDEQMQWENGKRNKAVVASPLYRAEAARQLAALVTHLEEKFGNQVAGYHPCGQNTGEWFYEGSWENPLSGLGPADTAAWHSWLRLRYGSDAGLRRGWGKSWVGWENAPVPTVGERRVSKEGIFRKPAIERHLIDFAEFQQEMMADCVCELAHAVRVASNGRKLVLFFYGYGFEFGALPNGPAVAGHYALRRVLECPDIDVLCSPISYFDRGPGGSAPAMSAAESVTLAGKMWLNEDDTHTWLATGDQPGSQDHVNTVEETNQELIRNLAQESCRNFGTWWMDLGATGWFKDRRMWDEMSRMRVMDEAFLKKPTPFQPEVAAVIDERSMCYLSAEAVKVTRPGVYEARAALGRMGAPYGQYLLDDVLAGRVKAKLYVFLNAWALNSDQRLRLLRATHGSTCICCYAPGYISDGQPSLEGAEALTGFKLSAADVGKAWAKPTDAGRSLGLDAEFGTGDQIRPLLAVRDAQPGEVLATYPDGSAAVAWRQTSDHRSIFVGVPRLTPELLRLAARKANVHLFTQTDCIVYANGRFIALHACQDGPISLNIKRKGLVVDAMNSRSVGRGPELQLIMKRGETRVLKY